MPSAAKVSESDRLDLEPANPSHSIAEDEESKEQPKAMDKPQDIASMKISLRPIHSEEEDLIDNEEEVGVVGVPNRAASSIAWSNFQTTHSS